MGVRGLAFVLPQAVSAARVEVSPCTYSAKSQGQQRGSTSVGMGVSCQIYSFVDPDPSASLHPTSTASQRRHY